MLTFKGYSLAEVIISMGLIALCLFFIISILPVSIFAVKTAEHTEVATVLGQNVLEDLRGVAFSQLDSYNGYSSSYTQTGYKNGVQYAENYIYNITVASVNLSTKDVLVRVTVPATIVSGKKVSIETLISE